jgi:hypothetical protein
VMTPADGFRTDKTIRSSNICRTRSSRVEAARPSRTAEIVAWRRRERAVREVPKRANAGAKSRDRHG